MTQHEVLYQGHYYPVCTEPLAQILDPLIIESPIKFNDAPSHLCAVIDVADMPEAEQKKAFDCMEEKLMDFTFPGIDAAKYMVNLENEYILVYVNVVELKKLLRKLYLMHFQSDIKEVVQLEKRLFIPAQCMALSLDLYQNLHLSKA